MEPFMTKKEKFSIISIVIIASILGMCLIGLNKLEEFGKSIDGENPKVEIVKIEEETYQEYLKSLVDKKVEIIENLSKSERLGLYGTLKKVYPEGIVIHAASTDPNSRYVEVFVKQDLIKWIVVTEKDLE
jgi:hypothetical protein